MAAPLAAVAVGWLMLRNPRNSVNGRETRSEVQRAGSMVIV
jgi:hypothetical protein